MARLAGNTIVENFDFITGVEFNTRVTDTLPNGTVITDAIVNNAFIFKNKSNVGGGYSVRSEYLEKNIIRTSWFNIKGDNIEDDTPLLKKVFASADKYDTVIFDGKKAGYVLSDKIEIKNPLEIDFDYSYIRGIDLHEFFDIQTNDVSMRKCTIDLDYTSYNGIVGTGESDNYYSGLTLQDITIKNQLKTATDYDGGVYLTHFSNVIIFGCNFYDINNEDQGSATDHSPAIKYVSCRDVWVDDTYIDGAGVGINVYNTPHASFKSVRIKNINNNGYYLQGTSKDIEILGGFIGNFRDAGVVFRLDSNYGEMTEETHVRITGVEFSNSHEYNTTQPLGPKRGVGVREGSGLTVTNCSFINTGPALNQYSGFDGCDTVLFKNNIIVNPVTDAAIRILFKGGYDITGNTIIVTNPDYAADYLCRFSSIDNVRFNNNTISVLAGTVGDGVSFLNAPYCEARGNKITGVTRKIFTQGTMTGFISEQDGVRTGEQFVQSGNSDAAAPPAVIIKSNNPGVTQNDYIGELGFDSSDTSGVGPGRKFAIKIKATGASGNSHTAEFWIEAIKYLEVSAVGAPTFAKPINGVAAETANQLVTLEQLQAVNTLPIVTGTTTISFTTNRMYGTKESPLTGNLVSSITEAKIGIFNLILHNSATAPTFDSRFKKRSDSGDYVEGVLNYIECRYIAASHVNYIIYQSAT